MVDFFAKYYCVHHARYLFVNGGGYTLCFWLNLDIVDFPKKAQKFLSDRSLLSLYPCTLLNFNLSALQLIANEPQLPILNSICKKSEFYRLHPNHKRAII
jgi:hypothetical protein